MQLRVFVVDDIPDIIEALTMVYNNHPDFKVVGAARDSRGTLEKLRQLDGDVDMISVDIQLGSDSGFELCRTLREEFPRLFIVMCSLEASQDAREEATNCGAGYFLSKPFGMEQLNQLVWAYRDQNETSQKEAASPGASANARGGRRYLADLLDLL